MACLQCVCRIITVLGSTIVWGMATTKPFFCSLSVSFLEMCPDRAAEATLPLLSMDIMLECITVSVATDTTSGLNADVNAAAIHALGLLVAHAAHLVGLSSEHRHNAARSSSSTVGLHTSPHAKYHVFWAIMQVLTG